MAFSFTFEETFEDGTKGLFNSETDTESRLDIAHYSTLARFPNTCMPFRGAYCMRVNLANDGTPADAYLQEDEGFDIAAAGTLFIRFYFCLSANTVMADNDEFIMLALQSAGPTNEVVVAINYTTANGFRVGIGETAGASFKDLILGQWHCMELKVVVDNAGNNDGTIDAWLDGAAFTQVASLDQGAIVQARLGVVGQDAGTTRGTLLIDQVVTDDTRVFPFTTRYPEEVVLTKSGHVFIGRGTLENVSLLSGNGTDCVLAVYDTDTAYTSDFYNRQISLNNTAANELVDPAGTPVFRFRYGCYITLAGTTPQAIARIETPYRSEAAIRNFGHHRKPDPIMG